MRRCFASAVFSRGIAWRMRSHASLRSLAFLPSLSLASPLSLVEPFDPQAPISLFSLNRLIITRCTTYAQAHKHTTERERWHQGPQRHRRHPATRAQEPTHTKGQLKLQMKIRYIVQRMRSAQQKQVPRHMRTRHLHRRRRGHVTLRPQASRALRHVVRVAVSVQFDCRSPRSKLVERHGPCAVFVELLEQRRGVLDLGAPRLKLGHGALQLLLVDQHVAGGVNLVEHHRQLEEVVDVAQHQTELQKFNKVLGTLVLQLAAQDPRLVECTLRDVAHSRRELVQLQHLEAAAVHLIVGQLPRLVLVELLEE
ncbi:hypothetical protein MOQ_001752, partial [Trypanosoma cruzi marinkellei]